MKYIPLSMRASMESGILMTINSCRDRANFLGEYMAGGVILIQDLNLCEGECYKVEFVGAGMHSGAICERGDILELGKELRL